MTDVNALALDRQLCFAVYATSHAFNRVYKPLLDEIGLTYPQYLAMLVLWEGDGLTVKRLGERLQLDSGTLTPLLKRLEVMGLVVRRRDSRDERQLQLKLTDAGRDLRVKAEALPRAIACAINMDQVGFDELLDSLNRLRAQLTTEPA